MYDADSSESSSPHMRCVQCKEDFCRDCCVSWHSEQTCEDLPYISGLHTSALPKDRITQPKVPQHSTPQHSTQGSSTLNPRFPNMRPWFKNASAYSSSTCPSHSNMHISHSKMPKSPVRAEIVIPEAQILYVERFWRDLFNAPCHGSVCGGGRHQNRVPILFYVCSVSYTHLRAHET